MTQEQEIVNSSEKPDDFRESLRKTLLLKQFAVRNGYKVSGGVLDDINELESRTSEAGAPQKTPTEEHVPATAKKPMSDKTKLDTALMALTSVTFPITVDSFHDSQGAARYDEFKRRLLLIGLSALFVAMVGLAVVIGAEKRLGSSAATGWVESVGGSALAISLGLLGAVVYSFFSVLGVIPAQTFDRKDEYALYARLELGVLLGWVFYFGFARPAYSVLATNFEKSQAFYLMIPFIAGYSTKFVVGVLERIMAALLVALGIEGKREARMKRTRDTTPEASGA